MTWPATAPRIALGAQGLIDAAPFGRGLPGTERALTHLGYVQIDTIAVVARAHHHTLWTRVPGFRPEHLDALIERRRAFEYWSHAAAYLPMAHYRFALPRMNAVRAGQIHWIRHPDRALMARIVDQIRAEGPLRARDFEVAPRGQGNGWWNWKPAKEALEQLFIQGDLMVSRRDGVEKVYDLPERVLPRHVDTRAPDLVEWAEHLIDTTLQAHAFAAPANFTYLRRGPELRTAVKNVLTQRVGEGRLTALTLPSGPVVYADPEVLDRRPRRPPPRVRLLSPFDNSIIDRKRTQHVHGFDYQIECYVKPSNRKYGYYCLPILYRDRLVGRLDAKADRAKRRFLVHDLHIERTIGDRESFLPALAHAVGDYARFNGCADIAIARVSPSAWRKDVSKLF